MTARSTVAALAPPPTNTAPQALVPPQIAVSRTANHRSRRAGASAKGRSRSSPPRLESRNCPSRHAIRTATTAISTSSIAIRRSPCPCQSARNSARKASANTRMPARSRARPMPRRNARAAKVSVAVGTSRLRYFRSARSYPRSASQPIPSPTSSSAPTSGKAEGPSGSSSFTTTSRQVAGNATNASRSSPSRVRTMPALASTVPDMPLSPFAFAGTAARSSWSSSSFLTSSSDRRETSSRTDSCVSGSGNAVALALPDSAAQAPVGATATAAQAASSRSPTAIPRYVRSNTYIDLLLRRLR